ncbi:FMN-dependent NADH-azoreductase [Umezawaea endophytica]|uniref:FMN dependent NADH:quinone oxidoreductase n=1 Tax=Umezawaea endophytica TaxID=1654476 RepID=A0A9X3A156_9PSEU|nr:NAD(P)H-dependent oxidoreductase [Umezawaea endophytica]MCS7479249.1 NAD(P)H-dependent oxidoreductase [Umezawaea endophytica]
MSLFRLDASIRVDGSHSREIADIVEQEWRSAHPNAAVTTRHIGVEPIPATAWATAVTAPYTPAEDQTPEQRQAVALASEAVDQLVDADALLFAVPLYNFGVSQHFKTWADLVITDPRMAPGSAPATKGKPAVLVTVRGGGYGPGTPREGWDHATAWMRRILAEVWEMDLKVVESELTLAEVSPQMESLRGLAAEVRVAAERSAREHGRDLADASLDRA